MTSIESERFGGSINNSLVFGYLFTVNANLMASTMSWIVVFVYGDIPSKQQKPIGVNGPQKEISLNSNRNQFTIQLEVLFSIDRLFRIVYFI